MSSTLYQQIKELAAQKPHLLSSFKSDLHNHDRGVLDKSRPGDQWIWVLQEYGTALLPCPVLAIEQVLLKDLNVHFMDIQKKLRDLEQAARSLAENRQNCFYHLAYRMDGTQTATEVQFDQAIALMSSLVWERFDSWRESVIGEASGLSNQIEGSSLWWNLCSVRWSSLDWLQRYKVGEEKVNTPGYRRSVAEEIVQIMQEAHEEQKGHR